MGLRAGDVLRRVERQLARVGRRRGDAAPDGRCAARRRPPRLQRAPRRPRETLGGAAASMYLPAMHLSVGSGTALASNAGNAGANAAAAGQGSSTYGGGNDAAQGCGRISDFDVAPRQQQLHAATIIAIDGITPGPFGAKAYPVKRRTARAQGRRAHREPVHLVQRVAAQLAASAAATRRSTSTSRRTRRISSPRA